MEIVFATNNLNKILEIQTILGDGYNIIGLKDAGIYIDIPEPHDNLTDNALEKARTIFELTKKDCFSEDTGLEIDALNGEPGVRSARYAGEESNNENNIDLVLSKMKDVIDRTAKFRTVICLIYDGSKYFFEGICNGKITNERKGEQGFGYDSIFIPDGSDKTFAQMTTIEKNEFSHRKKAVKKMIQFLKNSHAC